MSTKIKADILVSLFLALSVASVVQAEKPKLTDFKQNVYSQWGEDGIIGKIFEIIGTTSKVAIEFGAADGFWLSNTANLWGNDPTWSGILIEANPNSFYYLIKNINPYSCIAVNRMVGTSQQDSLEAILNEREIEFNIDLLSIDIDGNDYYIFQSLQKLRPRVIICEYNPSIPAHLDVYPNNGNYIGCSVAALQRVAAEKGYTLVAITETNCFFVQDVDMPKFFEYDTDRDHLRIDRYTSYIICDYSGRYKVIGALDFMEPWGWTGTPAPDECNGNILTLPKIVHY